MQKIFINLIFVCIQMAKTNDMTPLGEYLARKSVNKSMVARRTGLSKPRISELSLNATAKLRADELVLIAKAIDTDPCEMLVKLYGHLELKKES